MVEDAAKGFNQLYRTISFYCNNKFIGEFCPGEMHTVPEKDDIIVIAKKHYRVSSRQVFYRKNADVRGQLDQSKCVSVYLTTTTGITSDINTPLRS